MTYQAAPVCPSCQPLPGRTCDSIGHPWMVRSWPALLWQSGTELPGPFQHQFSAETTPIQVEEGDAVRLRCGQTIWAAPAEGCRVRAALAWDWVMLRPGVLALADPIGLVTNLRLQDAAGQELPADESLRRLNRLLHAIDWQACVLRALPEEPAAGAEPAGWPVFSPDAAAPAAAAAAAQARPPVPATRAGPRRATPAPRLRGRVA